MQCWIAKGKFKENRSQWIRFYDIFLEMLHGKCTLDIQEECQEND